MIHQDNPAFKESLKHTEIEDDCVSNRQIIVEILATFLIAGSIFFYAGYMVGIGLIK